MLFAFPTGKDVELHTLYEGEKQEHSPEIVKVISGGQTGADELGLKIAKELGIETGGTAPIDFKQENGNNESLGSEYNLIPITPEQEEEFYTRYPTVSKNPYIARTELNVFNSDGTLYFAAKRNSAGLQATKRSAERYDIPFYIVDLSKEIDIDAIKHWMYLNDIHTLNIAGNRRSKLTDENSLTIEDTLRKVLSKQEERTREEKSEAEVNEFDKKAVERFLNLANTYLSNTNLFTILSNKGKLLLRIQNNVDLIKDFIDNMNVNGVYELSPEALSQISKKWLPNGVKYTPEEIESILKLLVSAVNRHNHYFEKISSKKVEAASMNYTQYSMYTTIVDPINLTQAQSSVDGMTGPLKKIGNASASAGLVKTRTPGSFTNKAESILENLVGKDGISICAVGMKSFFGATAYNNWVMNHGTPEQKERLLIGPEHDGVTIKGKKYTNLANINPELSAEITEDLLLKFSNMNTDEDAALILSAMLSLATDKKQKIFQQI